MCVNFLRDSVDVVVKIGTEPVVSVQINACCSVCTRIKISAEDYLLLTKFTYNNISITMVYK